MSQRNSAGGGGIAGLPVQGNNRPTPAAPSPIPFPASIDIAAVAHPTHICSNRSCRVADGTEETLCCANPLCTKGYHLSCFKAKYSSQVWPKLKQGDVVCTKACYGKLLNPPKLNWTNDGANGLGDPHNSERILLDWLMVPGNYAKWRGGKEAGGQKKNRLLVLLQK